MVLLDRNHPKSASEGIEIPETVMPETVMPKRRDVEAVTPKRRDVEAAMSKPRCRRP